MGRMEREDLYSALKNAKVPARLQILREAWANLLLRDGLTREEVDLLQGRVGKSVFARYYFTVDKRRLHNAISKAISKIKRKIKIKGVFSSSLRFMNTPVARKATPAIMPPTK